MLQVIHRPRVGGTTGSGFSEVSPPGEVDACDPVLIHAEPVLPVRLGDSESDACIEKGPRTLSLFCCADALEVALKLVVEDST